MLKLRIYALFLMLVALVANAATPSHVLDRCASTLSSSPSVTVDFTIVGDDGVEMPSTLIVAAEKFRLSTPGMETWFDGTTQWTYTASDRSVSITEPTTAELLEVNPLAIVSQWKTLYNATPTQRANEIKLSAKSKGSTVKEVLLTVNPKTGLPAKMLIMLGNGQKASVLVKNIKNGKTMPASTFKYDKNRYPAKEVIDLR